MLWKVNEEKQFCRGNAILGDAIVKLEDSRYRPRGFLCNGETASENNVFLPLCLIGQCTVPDGKRAC